MDTYKIFLIAIICAVTALIIKQYRPEYAPFVELAGTAVILIFIITYIKRIISSMSEYASSTVVNTEYVNLLIKALGIAIISKVCSDICRDSGNTVLATDVEIGAKLLIIAFCIPMIKAVISLASGLIDV